MNNTYILHAGSELVEAAVRNSDTKMKLHMINPTLHTALGRILRKIHFKSQLKSKKVWVDYLLNKANIENKKENVLIIFDAPIWIDNIAHIRTKYSNVRIIFWFWNIVKDEAGLENIKSNCDKVFTFDMVEANKFTIEYHPQFYWNKEKKIERSIVNDIFFVGRNKKRIEILESIYLKCKQQGMSVYFYIVKDRSSDKSLILNLQNKNMEYSKVLELINSSKCILDVNQKGQSGLTLRALEALFLKKKLITDNKDLMNYDFYKPENILILDDLSKINFDFVNSAFVDVEHNILQKYTFDNWLNKLSN